jgi:FkbM family methyltransferase
MKYCLSEYDSDTIEAVRASFADQKSRAVFDAMTFGQADGQIWFRSIYEYPPYFGNDVFPALPDREILVDAGAYTGNHIAAFAKMNPRYAKVYAFEPYRPHYSEIQRRFAGETRVLPMQVGLYSANAKLALNAESPIGAHVQPPTGSQDEDLIDVVRLDDVAADATYVKMDIEGAELDAIAGGASLISNRKPKLAICVYHRPSDYIEIPLAIKQLRGDYSLFLRQHSPFNIDTVLYAM